MKTGRFLPVLLASAPERVLVLANLGLAALLLGGTVIPIDDLCAHRP